MRARSWWAVALAGCLTKPAPAPVNYMFVTSTTYVISSLGGQQGANTVCSTVAHRAGLSGNFVAWLSTPTQPAAAALAGSRGWQRTDDVPFVDTVDDLVAGKLMYPPAKDEMGADIPVDTVVATGTTGSGGDDAGNDCNGLQGSNEPIRVGLTGNGSPDWTYEDLMTIGCDSAAHLYCFGVGHQAELSLPVASPLVFLSTNPFHAADHRAAADTECESEAASRGLPGTFMAMLGIDATPAIARFGTVTTPWHRVDGVAATADFTTFTAPIDVDPDGNHVASALVYTGAANGVTNMGEYDCASWTTSDSTDYAYVGDSSLGDSGAFAAPHMITCEHDEPVYCAQMQ
ncbi:MAG TPA: hypothetical protein VMJ10_04980 [Kofleriaceae bacterium]|nr:hypothetical protein [Kofleriaceae bacterium]